MPLYSAETGELLTPIPPNPWRKRCKYIGIFGLIVIIIVSVVYMGYYDVRSMINYNKHHGMLYWLDVYICLYIIYNWVDIYGYLYL